MTMNSIDALENWNALTETQKLLILRQERVRRVSTRRFDLFFPDTGPIRRSLYQKQFDLFGVHPVKPWVRFDHMGLVPLLNGARVTALSDIEAVIEKPSGAWLTFRRCGQVPSEARPVWNLK